MAWLCYSQELLQRKAFFAGWFHIPYSWAHREVSSEHFACLNEIVLAASDWGEEQQTKCLTGCLEKYSTSVRKWENGCHLRFTTRDFLTSQRSVGNIGAQFRPVFFASKSHLHILQAGCRIKQMPQRRGWLLGHLPTLELWQQFCITGLGSSFPWPILPFMETTAFLPEG